jgi:hypothetical protein
MLAILFERSPEFAIVARKVFQTTGIRLYIFSKLTGLRLERYTSL